MYRFDKTKAVRAFGEYGSALVFGGAMYGALETLFRGYTHPSMILTGGICFALLYALDKHTGFPLYLRAVIASLIITTAELIAGCICNLWLGWGVWDYSHLHPNLWGQICLPFTFLWALLSLPAFAFTRMMRYVAVGSADHSSASAELSESETSSSTEPSGSDDELSP